MEDGTIVIVILLVVGLPLAVGIWLIARAISARDQLEELTRRVDSLQSELRRLKQAGTTPPQTAGEKPAPFAAASLPPKRTEETVAAPAEKTVVPPSIPEQKPATPPTAPESGFTMPLPPEPNIPPAEDLSIGESAVLEPLAPAPETADLTEKTPPPLPPLLIPPLPEAAGKSVSAADTTPAAVPPPLDREPVLETARTAAPAPAAPEKSLEMRVGTFWLVRIGIVILVTGLALGANLAYQNIVPKLGPAGKISLLYLASGLLLAAGAWWQRRNVKESLKNYAQVLFAGGLAAVYFTTYAAHYAPPVRVIESALVDGTLLFLWAGVIAGIADRRKSEVMALFAVGLAFFTSVITRVGEFTLYSNLLLTVAAVVFLVRNRWASLSYAGLITSYAGYAFWRFLHAEGWRWATPEENLWLGAGFLACYWAVFTAATFLSKSKHLSGASRAAFLTVNNGAYFSLFLLTMIQVHTGGFWKFSLGYGSVLLVLAAVAKRFLPAEPLTKNSYLTHGLVLVTLGFISKFAGLQLALVLGAESVLLFVVGSQRQSRVLQVFAYVSALLATGWCGATSVAFHPPDLLMAIGLGGLLAFNAGWALRLENRAATPPARLETTWFALLAFGCWAMAAWFHTAEPHFLVALVLGVESAAFYHLLGGHKITVPKIAAYASAVAAVGWNLETCPRFDSTGLWTGIALGAILILNTWRAHRESLERPEPLRPEPTVFTLLAFACWLATTWGNTTEEHLPLVLAAEAMALTFSIYALRIREIPLLGQSFLVLAQLAWVIHFSTPSPPPPWWNPLALIAVTIGLSHWWQHQQTLAISRKFYVSSSAVFAVAAVLVALVWLQPLLSAPAWLAVTSLLAVVVTGYGLVTRAWALAIGGQIFLAVSAWEFVSQLLHEKPEWYFALAPLAVLALLSFATLTWLARRPESAGETRQPLSQVALIYRWLALLMSLLWLWEYVPERQRVWACMLAAVAVFGVALWRNAREALLAALVYATAALSVLWVRDDLVMDVYWPNLLALLALLAMQQGLRRRAGALPLAENIHGAVVAVFGLSLWRFLSCWTPGSTPHLTGFSITMTWAGYAVAVFAAGMILHERWLRWLGLSVLAAAVGRVVLVDIWHEDRDFRVLTIIALGAALLLVGFLYNKFSEKIRQWL